MDAEKLIESQDKLVRDLEEKVHENTFRESTESPKTSSEEPAAATTVPQPPSPSSAIATQATFPPASNKQTEQPTNPGVPPDKQTAAQMSALTEQCQTLQDKVKKLEQANSALQVDRVKK